MCIKCDMDRLIAEVDSPDFFAQAQKVSDTNGIAPPLLARGLIKRALGTDGWTIIRDWLKDGTIGNMSDAHQKELVGKLDSAIQAHRAVEDFKNGVIKSGIGKGDIKDESVPAEDKVGYDAVKRVMDGKYGEGKTVQMRVDNLPPGTIEKITQAFAQMGLKIAGVVEYNPATDEAKIVK